MACGHSCASLSMGPCGVHAKLGSCFWSWIRVIVTWRVGALGAWRLEPSVQLHVCKWPFAL